MFNEKKVLEKTVKASKAFEKTVYFKLTLTTPGSLETRTNRNEGKELPPD